MTNITDEERADFLSALAQHGNASRAASDAGRARQSFYAIRASDHEFSQRWDAAEIEYLDTLKEHCQAVAVDGYEIVTEFYDSEGELTARRVEKRRDPKLALRILERRHPDYLPKSQTQVEGRSGVLVVPGKMTVEEWEEAFPMYGEQ